MSSSRCPKPTRNGCKDNNVEDTVRLIGELAQLSVAVSGDTAAVPQLLRHLLPTPTPAELASLPNGSCPDDSHHITRCPWIGLPPDVSPVAVWYRALMDTLYFDDEPLPLLAREFARLLDTF